MFSSLFLQHIIGVKLLYGSKGTNTDMLRLPLTNVTVENYKLVAIPMTPRTPSISFIRIAFAAAHVVVSPIFEVDP